MTRRLTRAISSTIILMSMHCISLRAAGTGQWVSQPSGLQTLNGAVGSDLEGLSAVRINPSKFRISVVDPVQVLGTSGVSKSYSLDELAQSLKPLALSNAGPTESFSYPVPAGLVIQDGAEKAHLKPSLRGGVFCTDRSRHTEIIPINEKAQAPSFDKCANAVQAGPMLIEDGKISGQLVNRPGMAVNRTAVALDQDGNVLLILGESVDLYKFATKLLQAQNVLSIRSALSLDGSSSSGLMYAADIRPLTYRKSGSTGTLIGSAILVFGAAVPIGPILSHSRCVKATVKERTWILLTLPEMDHPITLGLADLYRIDNGPDASRVVVINSANVYSGRSNTFDKDTPPPPVNLTTELRFSGHNTVNETFPAFTISGRMFTLRIVQLKKYCVGHCQTAIIEVCEAGR
jgi:uncharacterized protein YigE (DUF2233 family)